MRALFFYHMLTVPLYIFNPIGSHFSHMNSFNVQHKKKTYIYFFIYLSVHVDSGDKSEIVCLLCLSFLNTCPTRGSIYAVNSLRFVRLEKVNNRGTLLQNTEHRVYTLTCADIGAHSIYQFVWDTFILPHIYIYTHRTVDEILIIFYGNSVCWTP